MYKFLIFITFFSLSKQLSATHLIGGEINYKYIGNEDYEISMSVYRDCFLGLAEYDVPASILVYDGTGSFLGYFSVDGEPEVRLPIEIDDECYSAPPNICVQKKIYNLVGELPRNTTGYYLSYQRCCRNNSILNIFDDKIDNVEYSGMNLYTFIPPLSQLENSNPVFKEYPPLAICVNKPFSFDHSAVDDDGDSLVYKLCTPTDALSDVLPVFYPFYGNQENIPFAEVRWRSPYSLNDMLGGDEKLKINSKTGLLTAYPNKIGQFVVGVCVDEYRNGTYISQTRRDFQFNIGECSKASVAAFFTYDTLCNNLKVNFQNQSTGSSNYTWSFGDGEVSSVKDPSHTFPDYGVYDVGLIAIDVAGCADTTQKKIYLLKDDYELTTSNVSVCEGDSATLLINSVSTGVESVQWELNPNVYTPGLSYTYLPTASQNVAFTVHRSSGCKFNGTIRVQVNNNPTAQINVTPGTVLYGEQTISLTTNNESGYNYLWQSLESNSTPNLAQTNLLVTKSQWVYLTKTDKTSGCVAMDSVYIQFEKCIDTSDYIIEKSVKEFCDHAEISAKFSVVHPPIDFHWVVNGQTFSDSTLSFHVNYGDRPNWKLIMEKGGGNCIGTIELSDFYFKDRYLTFAIPNIVFCKEDTAVKLFLNIQTQNDYQVIWNSTNDTLTNTSDWSYSFHQDSGTTIPFVIIYNDSCKIEDSLSINLSPISVSAQAEPMTVLSGDTTTLLAMPQDYSSYKWYPSELVEYNQSSTSPAIVYETTDFIVVATNEDGCIATDTVQVQVLKLNCNEENIYIPTAFTPNGDGMNDVWKVRSDDVAQIQVAVYNRWGEKVFESNDIKRGWDGTFKGEIAESGSYAYYLTITCINQEQFFSKGNITLIR